MKNDKLDYLGQKPAPAGETAGSLLGHLCSSLTATIVLTIICCGIYPLIVWGIAQAIFPARANGSLVRKDGTFTTIDSQAVGSSLLGQSFSLPGYFHPRPSAAGSGYDPTSSGGSNLGPLSDKLINGATSQPSAPVPASTQPAATTSAASQPATTQSAETLAFDGVRLRTLHYATENNLSFKLYTQRSDGTGPRTEVPISKYSDAQGNLNDVALVDAFPHAGDAPDRMVLVAGDFSRPIPADAVTGSASGLDPHISPANAQLQIPRVAAARSITADQVQKLIAAHTDPPSLGLLGDPGVNVLMLNLALDSTYPLPAPPSTATATPAQSTTTPSASK